MERYKKQRIAMLKHHPATPALFSTLVLSTIATEHSFPTMHPLSILTLQAILAASVAAQDTIADIWVYSTDKCKDEAFSGSLDLSLYESNKVLTGEKWTCMYAQTDLVGFEDSGTQYTIYVDENTIPDDCSLVLYQGAPRDDSLNQGECQTYYATISNKDGGCVETKIAKEFGYA